MDETLGNLDYVATLVIITLTAEMQLILNNLRKGGTNIDLVMNRSKTESVNKDSFNYCLYGENIMTTVEAKYLRTITCKKWLT